MKSWKQKPLLMWLLVAGMLVMLPLLAALQHRWLGEVSQAERERMQANLRTSAERLCADFDRELTNIYVQFQLPALPGSDRLEADFNSRYRRWIASAPNPKLVSDVYRVWFDETGELKLIRFNEASNSFEPVEWPEKLLAVRSRFESEQTAGTSAQNFLREILKPGGGSKDFLTSNRSPAFVFQISLGLTADDIPALIIPDAGDSRANIHSMATGKRACTLAVLDAELIKNEILPSLIKRHFSADGVDEYNMAVVRGSGAHEAVYQSDAGIPLKAFEQNDARSSLFRIRAEEADRILVTGMKLPLSPAPPQPPPDPAASETGKSQSSRVAVRVLQSDVRVARSGDGTGEGHSQKIEIHRPFTNPFDNEGGWQLLVKHRAGSLDAAVANVRHRNLVISFGILLLLGASVGFIVMSSRRAERLATQQMEFVAGVSHELRTPLAVICSAAENLADGVIDNGDQIKRYGGLIRDEGRRLTGMVEQVLEFAGAQSGRKTYELRPTDLNGVIEDAVAAYHLQLVEGGFELEKNITAGLPAINGDAAALSRAIQNLLSNAMKYSGDSRWIGLRVQWNNLPDCSTEVQIKISDRGLGISSGALPHIFEPFYRGKEVVAGQIHGNGLGLSLVKHIAEEHGGRISVESSEGQGSTFTLILPPTTPQELTANAIQEIYEQTNPAR